MCFGLLKKDWNELMCRIFVKFDTVLKFAICLSVFIFAISSLGNQSSLNDIPTLKNQIALMTSNRVIISNFEPIQLRWKKNLLQPNSYTTTASGGVVGGQEFTLNEPGWGYRYKNNSIAICKLEEIITFEDLLVTRLKNIH